MPKNKTIEEELGFVPEDAGAEADLAALPNQGQQVTPTGLPKIVRDVAQIATTPERGMRGVGVGVQDLMSGVSPGSLLPGGTLSPNDVATIRNNAPEALNRAAEAVQPGFVPRPGEELGAAAGQVVGSLPLATALGGSGTSPSMIYNVLRQAGAGGALSAIEQASERGDIDIADVALTAGLSAMLPIIKPTMNGLKSFIRSIGRETLAGSTSLSREAAQEFIDNPKLLKEAIGTAESVSKKVVDTQKALITRIDDAGTKLAESRKPFGIGANLDQKAEDIIQNGLTQTNEQDLLKQSKEYLSGYRVSDDIIKGKTTEKIPFKDRVRGLYETRMQLDPYIKWRSSGQAGVPPNEESEKATLINERDKINKLLDTFAETDKGVKNLRGNDASYSEIRQIYDNLQKKLASEETAEQTLMKIQKGDNPDEILGLTGGVVDRIRKLEKDMGIKIIDPLRKELLAVQVRGLKAKGASAAGMLGIPAGAAAEAIGPENLSKLLEIFRGSSHVFGRLAESASSPAGRATGTSIAAQRRNQ